MDQIGAVSRAVVSLEGMDELSLSVIKQVPFTSTLKKKKKKWKSVLPISLSGIQIPGIPYKLIFVCINVLLNAKVLL